MTKPEPIAWRREGNSLGLRRYSREHLMRDGAERTLCGKMPNWATVGHSNDGRCLRCWKLAEAADR